MSHTRIIKPKETAMLANHVFPELALTLFFFIERLYSVLLEQGIKQVYFLSREGQPLKQMFEIYREHLRGDIDSYYLEVSRRSTLLPSLGPLAEEKFQTLFRQYRRISLFEFLSSLGLEENASIIAENLDLPHGAETIREEDFPTSQTFAKLRDLQLFQNLYDTERKLRCGAFKTYLAKLSDGKLPSNLAVVDVGWKGTIQDNLFAILSRNGDTPVNQVTGFYIGLDATRGSYPGNNKYGLLFSSVGILSPKFRIFSENRSLFEVILAADHGSIVSYASTKGGHAHPIRGRFDEVEMLSKSVFPVLRQLIKNFEQLVTEIPQYEKRNLPLFDKVVRGHSRMVFNPTQQERIWFSSISHSENFGVFECSLFTGPKTQKNIFQKFHFIFLLLRQGSTRNIGFWPWKTLYEEAGAFPAWVYATIRRIQR